ncbi:MAG: hypothetical protein JXR87_07875 [Candidatus Marinimicrobia bacterium]|nr:hypothetical protein [Candidatus Neomarinimicrobiota bacterium]
MIFLVTGDVNEGKTSYMQSLYRELGEGDGFICPKVMNRNILVRYDIEQLSSGKAMPFAAPLENVRNDWDEQCRFGNYSFSKQAIQYAERVIDKIIEDKTEPFFIDEIGPLEIENRNGFHSITKKIIESGLEGFIVVRKSMIDKFIQKFQTEKSDFLPIGINKIIKHEDLEKRKK